MSPTQIATQAAEAIAKMVAVESEISAGCAAQYAFDNDKAAALILSAAARIVRESGAVGLLSVAKCPNCDGRGWYEDIAANVNTGEAEQIQQQCQWCDEKSAALHSLRSITGEAQPSPADPGSAPDHLADPATRRLVIVSLAGQPLFDGPHDGAPYTRDLEVLVAGSRWRIVSTTDAPRFQTVIVSRT